MTKGPPYCKTEGSKLLDSALYMPGKRRRRSENIEDMERIPTVRELIERGKKGAAKFILKSRSLELLKELLDIILDPTVPLQDWDVIDWLKWLIAGGNTPDEFLTEICKFDNATMCGLVWTANFVAYRCRTCGVSPCMSICDECFHNGQHEGHDFNMFRSQAGGACDCGDSSVMRSSGFCCRHNGLDNSSPPVPPSHLTFMAEKIMPRIFLRIIQYLREHSIPGDNPPAEAQTVFGAECFFGMLSEFSAMGAAMRRIITMALTDPRVYKQLMKYKDEVNDLSFFHFTIACDKSYKEAMDSFFHHSHSTKNGTDRNSGPSLGTIHRVTRRMLRKCLDSTKRECTTIQRDIKHKTFLEELVFWTVKYEFPQKVVCFLLNMLPDSKYKEALTEAFVMHYSRIAVMLERSTDPDTLSNRVVHVSVQLFSNEDLAYRMTTNNSLLYVMVASLKNMMNKILVVCNLSYSSVKHTHEVVNCAASIMKEHCYWPLVSDLNNVLSHRPIAIEFMSNIPLLDTWFAFLSSFQGMNVNTREVNQHIEYEPNTYYAAFSAELEASAYPMWALITHLTDEMTLPLTMNVLNACVKALKRWICEIDFQWDDWASPNRISFHFPLHRYLSAFICQAVNVQGMDLADVLPEPECLAKILIHPLRIQVGYYEIINGLWIRNGLQIKGQAMTYIQCNFCSSMVDADLYLLQICATSVPGNEFMDHLLSMFHVKEWFSLITRRYLLPDAVELEMSMLESFLQFLASFTCIRTNLGVDPANLTRMEMVTLLAMSDRMHSQLLEQMPERCGASHVRDFESILKEVADYRAPNLEACGSLQQGIYVPKPCVWEELFDPIHALLRSVYKRDFQNAMDRFIQFANSSKKLNKTRAIWPPFRIPLYYAAPYVDPRYILKCRIFHSIIWMILYKAVNEHDMSDQLLPFAVFLLELAVSFDIMIATEKHKKKQNQSNPPASVDVCDGDLSTWFPSDSLPENVVIRIGSISQMKVDYGLTEFGNMFSSQFPTSFMRMLHDRIHHSSASSSSSSENLVFNPANDLGNSSSQPSTSYAGTNNTIPTNNIFSEDSDASSSHGNPLDHSISISHVLLDDSASNADFNDLDSPGYQLPPFVGDSMSYNTEEYASSVSGSTTNQFNQSYRDQDSEFDVAPHYRSKKSKVIKADESIISLLLKLHSKLSNAPNSFDPSRMTPDDLNNRIGYGEDFVAKVLYCIMKLDANCKQEVLNCCSRGHDEQSTQQELEEREKMERKKLVSERQQRIMKSFADTQQEFLDNNKDDVEESMEWECENASNMGIKEYECVICNQTTPSVNNMLMGAISLIQASNVLSHRRCNSDSVQLPMSNNVDNGPLKAEDTFAHTFGKHIEQMSREFENKSMRLAVNFGWQGGIYAQTCGHYVHLRCLRPYLSSLGNLQRSGIDRINDEYRCPLCRRLANTVLPLPPEVPLPFPKPALDGQPSFKATVDCLKDVITHLENAEPDMLTELSESMKKSLEDMLNATPYQYLVHFSPRQPSTLLSFVSSVARTNLELEISQRGGTLQNVAKNSSTVPQRSVLVPLFHTLAQHSKLLGDWNQLKYNLNSLLGAAGPHSFYFSATEQTVPLLFRDPVAILLQFVLQFPLDMDPILFSSIVRLLYNLVFFEIVAQVSYTLKPRERNYFRSLKIPITVNSIKNFTFVHAMKFTIDSLPYSDIKMLDRRHLGTPNLELLELKVRDLCLPFLRIAAILKHHLHNEPLPKNLNSQDEFIQLFFYLKLVPSTLPTSRYNPSFLIGWPCDNFDFLNEWFQEVSMYAVRGLVTRRSFIPTLYINWFEPKLINLPYHYDKIFQYYHKKACSSCKSVPPEASLCLVCGAVVCLKQQCCRRGQIFEAVQHSINCGAGTGLYLVVQSSYVVVLRGKRACLWGSVYLDSFGEEDRELKRGRPLYLSVDRYKLLEDQWISHRFDHTNRKWVWHRDQL